MPDLPHAAPFEWRLSDVDRHTKSAQDNYGSIGTYMCSDLACVDYVRGTKTPDGTTQMTETLTVEEKEERVLTNVRSLITSVEKRLKK